MKNIYNLNDNYSNPISENIDLNDLLLSDVSIVIKVKGDSMDRLGINHGDILIIETKVKTINARDIVFVKLNKEYIVRQYILVNNKQILIPGNNNYPIIEIEEEDEFEIKGIVRHIIKTIK